MAPTPQQTTGPRPNPPAPQGPRPLALHMALQTLTWVSSLSALPGLRNGSLPWSPDLKQAAEALRRNLETSDPDAFAGAVDAEARRRTRLFADAVAAYRRHPRAAPPPEPPVVWRAGPARLLDYGAAGAAADGAAVLAVPSLINRAYILDLTERFSLMRYLAAVGLRPYLLDWGVPGAAERRFGLTDYIAGPLQGAFDFVAAATDKPPAVVGYCMGGLLALALASRIPGRTASLALLATPWDFHAEHDAQVRFLAAMAPGLNAYIETAGELPVDCLQAMFASLNPYLTLDKFRRFADLAPDSDAARHFVAVEDWLNDGMPLAGPVARECLFDWYVANAPMKGEWRVGGAVVRPEDVAVPTLVAAPSGDTIVPPASAEPLAGAIPGARLMSLAGGHIGMMVGGRAAKHLYRPLAQWLAETASPA